MSRWVSAYRLYRIFEDSQKDGWMRHRNWLPVFYTFGRHANAFEPGLDHDSLRSRLEDESISIIAGARVFS